MEQIDLILDALGKGQGLLEGGGAGQDLLRADAVFQGHAAAHFLSYGVQHLQGEAAALLRASAVGVRPMVDVGGEELGGDISVAPMDEDHVKARLPGPAGLEGIAGDDVFDFALGNGGDPVPGTHHIPGDGELDAGEAALPMEGIRQFRQILQLHDAAGGTHHPREPGIVLQRADAQVDEGGAGARQGGIIRLQRHTAILLAPGEEGRRGGDLDPVSPGEGTDGQGLKNGGVFQESRSFHVSFFRI